MVTTKNDTKIPSSTTDVFTTDHKSVDLNANYSYDWSKDFNFGCWYLLPCGLCMKTDKPCPKHGSTWNGPTWDGRPIIWTNYKSTPNTNTINTNYTTGELKND